MIALLLGCSLTLGYAPFSLWWVVIIALSAFFYLLAYSPTQQPFKLGFAFGLGWFGAGISWVHVSIADYGGLPLIGSLSLMLILCSYLALYPALFCKLVHKYFKPQQWPIVAPLFWLVVEWLRGWMLTGFPWLSLGYSQLHSPFAGWLPITGEFGVSALLVMMCMAMACWLPLNKLRPTGALIAILMISGLALQQYSWVTPSGKTIKIAMVQGNILQSLRWTPEEDEPTMNKYRELTANHWDADVIIWPEAAVPKLEAQAQAYLRELDQLAASHQTGLITGVVNYNFETGQAFNNLLGLGQKETTTEENLSRPRGQYYYGHGNRFAKHHLLPIGEFIPFEDWLRGLAPIFDLPMSSFARGPYQQNNLEAKGYYFAPAICFEIAFPAQISANLYDNTSFIVTVSNDAWFGHSHGPAQHLEIAQMRAIEFGLPVLRATNNGITAVIQADGKIQSRLPQFEAAVLSDKVSILSGKTPYRRFGNWPIILLSLLLFVGAITLKKRS